jgi:ppGpp synthetase/RelA/SpoT-type nucleotidyltranferase
LEYFRPIELKRITPDDESKFGYEGYHCILIIPTDIRNSTISTTDCPEFFELQIKTLYQHAWAQANHDLSYKPEKSLDSDFMRKVAFTAAQSWGADLIFNELANRIISEERNT